MKWSSLLMIYACWEYSLRLQLIVAVVTAAGTFILRSQRVINFVHTYGRYKLEFLYDNRASHPVIAA